MALNGFALQHVPGDFLSDKEVVLAAVRKDGHALEYASATLRADRRFILEAVKQNGLLALHCDAGILRDDIRKVPATEPEGENGLTLL